jgi:hypothetical protein
MTSEGGKELEEVGWAGLRKEAPLLHDSAEKQQTLMEKLQPEDLARITENATLNNRSPVEVIQPPTGRRCQLREVNAWLTGATVDAPRGSSLPFCKCQGFRNYTQSTVHVL